MDSFFTIPCQLLTGFFIPKEVVIKCDINHPFVTIIFGPRKRVPNCFCDDPNRPSGVVFKPVGRKFPGWGFSLAHLPGVGVSNPSAIKASMLGFTLSEKPMSYYQS